MDWFPMESTLRPAVNELVLLRFKHNKNYTIYRYLGNDKWTWVGHKSVMSLARMLMRFSYWARITDPE